MRLFAILALIVLAACQAKSVNEMSYTEIKDYGNRLLERCRKQGAAAGAEMQVCINQEVRADEARRQNAIATRQRIGGALAAAGAGYNNAVAANRPYVSCTHTPSSTWVGGPISSVRTTCY